MKKIQCSQFPCLAFSEARRAFLPVYRPPAAFVLPNGHIEDIMAKMTVGHSSADPGEVKVTVKEAFQDGPLDLSVKKEVFCR